MSVLAVFAGEVPAAYGDKPLPLSADAFLARIKGALPEFERGQAKVSLALAGVADAKALAPLLLGYEREQVFVDGEGLVQKSALVAGWSVDVPGARGKRIRGAEFMAVAALKRGQRDAQLITSRALDVYYRAARARLRVESQRASHEPLEKLTERLRHRVREGDASGYELAGFELELSQHEARLAEAETENAVAAAGLSALIGVSEGSVVANDRLEVASLSPRVDLAGARAARADLDATRAEIRSGQALTSAAARWWIPTLHLRLGYMNTDLGPGTGPGADLAHGYTGMISASIPVFTRGAAERERGRARMVRARSDRRVLERQIPLEIRKASLRLAAQIKRVQAFEARQLVQVADLVRKTEGAYGGGEASALELREAYHEAEAARLQYIELRYQSRLAELELRRAMGQRPLGGLQ